MNALENEDATEKSGHAAVESNAVTIKGAAV